ncbi:hypothetical protein SBOR_7773 [Sclerotinia borealis F-4128]|uniref:DNA/RNA-binding domain-containing protein n=1 Tax=Sclerotinia borealis (strain F-4128) TaxID=1432307 RepID=W9C7L4_SCLBF|nr:hypothetical protein SBOR_7773 [Sclerotinia borealis F-4128]
MPLTRWQLVAEVKGIYDVILDVESRCIKADVEQAALLRRQPSRLSDEQWQALMTLHRALLYEYHDFLMASQHPSASPALRWSAQKFAVPARVWRHGIYSFLENLRSQLPKSLDHILAFLYLAYSVMAVLYETIPGFQDTWIECLGDIARYRMAIEDGDTEDRGIWTQVAYRWYLKASYKLPGAGRLYHHLGIITRGNTLHQLHYFTKALCAKIPFIQARESILTLFDPVLNSANSCSQFSRFETVFIMIHGHLYKGNASWIHEMSDPETKELLGLLDSQIGRFTATFKEQGCYMAISNVGAELGYGLTENPIMKAMMTPRSAANTDAAHTRSFRHAEYFSNSVLEIVLQRIGDPNTLPFIYITLIFIFNMSRYSEAMDLLAPAFAWQSLVIMLNTLFRSAGSIDQIEDKQFPFSGRGPLAEDYALRGLVWSRDETMYPETWSMDRSDGDEIYLDLPCMLEPRKARILWLACRIAEAGPWIHFDNSKPEFSVSQDTHSLESCPDIHKPVSMEQIGT